MLTRDGMVGWVIIRKLDGNSKETFSIPIINSDPKPKCDLHISSHCLQTVSFAGSVENRTNHDLSSSVNN